ncbi:histidine phosphatase family protein [Caldibacillus lycopersici]|uniref:Histidine phosphatase family protein n=1 Tax=Perspicuibacillus lycopersici TaxID=1325689 RepID=A0AAE3IUS3_9BACI|nr:histidine phosphatase family protein [Perspicuibacillus lycopersici]MCU9615020.1 histidine phosphatase family protein [Perspicuibacillus lycopersici]
MELIIIRHGQSEADILNVHEGRADFPLTSLGELQARKMAKYVAKNIQPEIIISSPLKRAKQTAEILQTYTKCELLLEPNLMEFNNGVLAGLSREEAAHMYPLPKSGRPIYVPIKNGESELEFRYRADYVFHKIITEYNMYNRVAIVSHGGLISNLLQTFLDLPVASKVAFATGDTGFHYLAMTENSRIIKFLNMQAHLQVESIR